MTLSVLGRPVSEPVARLYFDALAVQPESEIRFRLGSVDELEDVGRGAHFLLKDGSSEILLDEDWNEGIVGHELAHALFVRQGHPQIGLLPNFGASYGRLSPLVGELPHHAFLYDELAARQIPDDGHWPDMIEKVASWNLSSEPSPVSDGGLHNVRVVAELVIACPIDASQALSNVRDRYPNTWAAVQEIARDVRGAGKSPQSTRAAMVRVLWNFEQKLRKAFPSAVSPREVFLIPAVFGASKLKRPAAEVIDIQVAPKNPNLVSVLSKQDSTLVGTIPSLAPVARERLREIRLELGTTSTKEFLAKYGIRFSHGS